MPPHFKFLITAMSFGLASLCAAQSTTPSTTPPSASNTAPVAAETIGPVAARYAGSYRRGSVDSVEQLVLLPDNTYCYAVMAGSLDLFSGGRWQVAPGNNGALITLQEVKPAKPLFPAFAINTPDKGTQVVFNFHGRSMSNADAPVFAVSANDTPPKTMQRLFSPDHNGWASNYPLPAIDAANAQYFYIGHLQREARGQKPRLQVTQYKLDNANTVRIGFDRIQAMPLIAFSAQLVKNDDEDVLQLDGRKFGRKRELSPKLAEDARANCITPALHPETVPVRPQRDGSSVLVPVKDFYLSPDAVQTKPWFDMKTKDAG
jgi:hypothetical protein